MDQFCSICRFWRAVWSLNSDGKRSKRGVCRRYAPRPSPLSVEFPRTRTDDWCGEFEPRESERRQFSRD